MSKWHIWMSSIFNSSSNLSRSKVFQHPTVNQYLKQGTGKISKWSNLSVIFYLLHHLSCFKITDDVEKRFHLVISETFSKRQQETSPPIAFYVRQFTNWRLFNNDNTISSTTRENILTFCQCPLFCTHKPHQIRLYQLFDVH